MKNQIKKEETQRCSGGREGAGGKEYKGLEEKVGWMGKVTNLGNVRREKEWDRKQGRAGLETVSGKH